MREIVEQAVERRPAPEPRPEQIWFSGAHHMVGQVSVNLAEREICE
jgi:hypothetical protein